MGKIILGVNPGSETRKYALFNDDNLLVSMHFELSGKSKVVTIITPDNSSQQKLSTQEYKQPLSFFLIWAISNEVITSEEAVDLVGLRVLAPGSYFQKNRVLSQAFLDKLTSQQNKAPLHITAATKEAKELMKKLPRSRLVAVSDSAFHATMHVSARDYAIAQSDSKKLDIHRFGYHGISNQSALRKLSHLAGGLHGKVIVCHLGGGASVTAIRNGKSFDTSMGYSPTEGPPMTTRSGDIGPSAVFELMQSKNLSGTQAQSYLNTQSGLLGLSGSTGDIRKLLDLYSEGHAGAKRALDHYAYSFKKYIGSYIGAMNGLDILVFTGTAGERSAPLRKLICKNMDNLGIKLDGHKNSSLKGDGFVNAHGQTGIAVIRTDEMHEIAAQVVEV